jgi:uncharacterized OB-fold protein
MNGTYFAGDPNYAWSLGTPTGWKCPECGRVYAPHVTMCFYCPITAISTNQTAISEEWKKQLQQTVEHIKNHPPFTS